MSHLELDEVVGSAGGGGQDQQTRTIVSMMVVYENTWTRWLFWCPRIAPDKETSISVADGVVRAQPGVDVAENSVEDEVTGTATENAKPFEGESKKSRSGGIQDDETKIKASCSVKRKKSSKT
ncbi:hypothetical protein FGIG_05593 [Fasciola gigantica]|uniref:Uncharacterized protein n=1 Tax=Fasciola gigantica TaxID=46835 RepID=A0A504YD04_FASGI|nr:hypothetical protein FGIG_05593 [Fasciola gigantica]